MSTTEGTRIKEYIKGIVEQDKTLPLPGNTKLSAEIADNIMKRLDEIAKDANRAQGPNERHAVATDLHYLAVDIENATGGKGNRTSAQLKNISNQWREFAKNQERTD